jgi:hypothetical protein
MSIILFKKIFEYFQAEFIEVEFQLGSQILKIFMSVKDFFFSEMEE